MIVIPFKEIFKICKYNIPPVPAKAEYGYLPCLHPEAKKAFCSSDCPARKRMQEKASIEEM